MKRAHTCYAYTIRRQTNEQQIADDIQVSHAIPLQYLIHLRMFGAQNVLQSSVRPNGKFEHLTDEEADSLMMARFSSSKKNGDKPSPKATARAVLDEARSRREGIPTTLDDEDEDETPQPARKRGRPAATPQTENE